jgi:hypothetical protein
VANAHYTPLIAYLSDCLATEDISTALAMTKQYSPAELSAAHSDIMRVLAASSLVTNTNYARRTFEVLGVAIYEPVLPQVKLLAALMLCAGLASAESNHPAMSRARVADIATRTALQLGATVAVLTELALAQVAAIEYDEGSRALYNLFGIMLHICITNTVADAFADRWLQNGAALQRLGASPYEGTDSAWAPAESDLVVSSKSSIDRIRSGQSAFGRVCEIIRHLGS